MEIFEDGELRERPAQGEEAARGEARPRVMRAGEAFEILNAAEVLCRISAANDVLAEEDGRRRRRAGLR